MEGFAFECSCCGQRHVGMPAIAFDGPAVGRNDAGEPWQLDRNGGDFCIADGQHHFVRAVMRVPIIGSSEPMEWGVWGSLSEANFKRYWDSFRDSDQSKLGPMFSYLGNAIPGYPNSLGLRSSLHPQDNRQRPFVEFDSSQDHPLVRDQTQGVSRERAIELLMPALHPDGAV